MFERDTPSEPDLMKGFVAGLAAGLIASFVMEQFQALWRVTSRKLDLEERKPGRKPKSATVRAADAIAERVVGHKVEKKHQRLAGEAVHYAMGGTSAALYGMLAEVSPVVRAGEGTAFGAVVWLAADEASVPALGLTKSPARIPMGTHLYTLVSHLVYGAVTEAVRRAFRKIL